MSEQALPRTDGAPPTGDTEPPPPDVAAIVGELQAEVLRKRAAGAYPTDLLERLHTEFHPDEGLEPPEVRVLVESARVVRRLLAWYVAPIAQDQTRFNLAILRELRALEERVARLEERRPPEPEKGTRPRAPR